MPFTFSHPAIVLPLTRLPKHWYSLTGLVVGSVTPDFEYFFRMNIQSIYSHTLWGILYFDLPIGLLLCFIYHAIVRDIIIDNTPSFISKHLVQYKTFKWMEYFRQNWLVVMLSIIIGAFSHIFWDDFTHGPGYFVHMFPFLKQTVIQTASFRVPLYTLLQHISSVVGMFFIFVYIKKLPITGQSLPKIDWKYWLYIAIVTAAAIALRFVLGKEIRLVGDVIITIFSGILLAITVVSAFMNRGKQPVSDKAA